MASWYSNILTNTSSKISLIQRSVFASEADGDTEDDTHVCRVLRQYYNENGRPLPNWLPPDPKAPPPAPIIQQNSGPAASRYGSPQQGAQGQGGLSSLWDNNRGAGRGAGAAGSRNPFARNAATPDPAGREPVQARPLPSQRAGSVQSNSVDMGSGGGGGGGASSAQDRLRQRLYGGGARTTSPSSSTGPFAPPPAQGGGGGMSRSRGGSAANAGSGDYDPYGPGGQFDSGGGGGGGGGNRYGGLPSGPRRMGGLPSGPRMR